MYIECKIRRDSVFEIKAGNTLLPIENNDSITKFLKEGKIELEDIETYIK